MTRIKKIEIDGFKSFGKKINIKFDQGFTCIVGANGSGKSNVIDALCFVMGHSSSKSMRGATFSDLIFSGSVKSKGASSAKVTLFLNNEDRMLPFEMDEVTVSREAFLSGKSTYRLNGRQVTRFQIVDLFSLIGIESDGYNIVMQGAIARIVHASVKERQKVLENISGISVYDEKKEKSQKELEKANRNLEKLEYILRAHKENMDALEEEKYTALEAQSLETQIEELDKTIMYSQQFHVKTALDEVTDEITQKKTTLEQQERELEAIGRQQVEEGNNLRGFQVQIRKFREVDLPDQQKVINSLRQDLSSRKTDLRNSTNRVNELKKQVPILIRSFERTKMVAGETQSIISELESQELEIQTRISSEDQKLKVILAEKQELDHLVSRCESEKRKLQAELNDFRRDLAVNQVNQQSVIKELKTLESTIQNKELEQKNYDLMIIECESSIDSLQEHLEQIEADLNDSHARIKDLNEAKHALKGEKNQLLARITSHSNRILEIKSTTERIKNALLLLETRKNSKRKELETTRLRLKDLESLPTKNCESCPHLEEKFKERNIPILENLRTLEDELSTIMEEENKLMNEKQVHLKNNDLQLAELQLTNLELASKTIDEKLASLDSALTEANERREEIEKDLERTRARMKTERDLIQHHREAIAKREEEIQDLRQDHLGLGKRLKDIHHDFQRLQSQTLTLKQEISQISLKLSKLDRDGVINRLTAGQQEIQDLHDKRANVKLDLTKYVTKLNDHLNPKENELQAEIIRIINLSSSMRTEKTELRRDIQRIQEDLNQELEIEAQLKSELADLTKEEEVQENEIKNIQHRERLLEKGLASNKIKVEELIGKSYHLHHKLKEINQIMTEQGSPFDPPTVLSPDKISEKADELKHLKQDRRSLDPINMKSITQYEQVRKRYLAIVEKEEALLDERMNIMNFIEEIENEKRSIFMQTFTEVNKNFTWIYKQLSNGGSAQLVLLDEADPFSPESGVAIIANPAGKKIKDLRLASGGEKSLITLAFIFALQQFQPAPFYILDEIDAALDETNARNVSKIISEFAKTGNSQFILVSLRDATMINADKLIGITNVDGISSAISLNLNDLLPQIPA